MQDAKKELAEAQRRVSAAAALVSSCDESVSHSEDAVVDAELEEPSVWNDMYKKLKAYKDKHGNCWVPKRKKENDPEIKKLGT